MKSCGWMLLLGCVAFGGMVQANPTCEGEYTQTDATDKLPPGLAPQIGVEQAPPKSTLDRVFEYTGDLTIEYILTHDNHVNVLVTSGGGGGTFETAYGMSLSTYNATIDGECGVGFRFTATAAQLRAKDALQANASSSSPPASGKTNDGAAIGDFNGDGALDNAVLSSSGIQVTLNNADGSVLSTATYPVAGIGPSIAAADFNNDGKLDLAVTATNASGQGSLVILLGKGDGTFQSPTQFPAGDYAFYLATADFNGDGALDVAITDVPATATGAGQVSVLLGKGDGTFATAKSYPVGRFPATIVADDFNGDGKVDLVALDSSTEAGNKVWFLPGNGDGTFGLAVATASSTGTGYLAYTDLNHDGKLDLVIADQFASAAAVMLGNGDGSFQPSNEYVVSAQPVSIAAIPMDDGNTLILTGDSADGNLISNFVASNGTAAMPVLQTLGMGPAAIATGDLNGDHQPDLVITDPATGGIYVELATGKGQFGSPVTYSLGTQPGAVAIADVNGDGKPDVIAADATGIDVLLGNGNGKLGAVNTFPASGSLSSITIVDFNGDGKPDVAAASAAGGNVSVFLGNGDGTFQAAQNVALAGGLVPLSTVGGDVNGDGKPDLIVAFNNSNQTQPGGVAVLLGKGDGTFQAPVNITLAGPLVQQTTGSALSAALTLGDVNGDGKLDVVTAIQSSLGNQVVVLLGNANGSFQAPLLTTTNTAPPMIAIADINGDGKPDLVLGDCCGLTEASEMFGNGNGTFQAEVQFSSGPSPAGIAIADFEDSGWPDLAIVGQVQSPVRGTLSILSNPFRYVIVDPIATVVSAANSTGTAIAPGSLATAYGSDLAKGTPGATSLPLPTTFGGTSLTIIDSAGTSWPVPLIYVSSGQVNFYVPTGVATGSAQFTVTSGDGTQSAGSVQVATVAPGIFTLNSANLAAAIGILVSSSGKQTPFQVYKVSGGAVVANPINLGSASDQVVLELYGTGIQAAGTSNVEVTVGGTKVPVQYAGKSSFEGEDQVNILLPHSLAGAGNVRVQVTASGIVANPVQITIQ
jgi:uncharacterized protein (TIGR03437 family)